MAKDTKRSPGNRNSGGGNGSPLLAGLLVGLAIGIVAAIGVAYYINRSANPFSSPAMPAAPASAKPNAPQTPEILRPGVGKEDAPVAPSASAPEQKGASGVERFDFYTMLPGLADKNGKDAKPVATQKPEASTPVATSRQWLQAGAFQNEKDADNLKAKLALIGIEARIQTQDIPGKGLWHRVRVGPYGNPADLDRAKGQLHANGIESVAVKAD